MADLAANISSQITKGDDLFNFQIVNAEVIYQGAFLGLNTVYNATSAAIGRIEPFDNSAEQLLVGEYAGADEQSDGTVEATGATSDSVPPGAGANLQPRILENAAVAGVTAMTVIGQLVYVTTDNPADMTLTRPTYGGNPVGFVLRYAGTSGFADVLDFGLLGRLLYGLGGGTEHLFMGNYPCASVSASGTVLTATAPFHGRILQMRTSIGTAMASATATHTLIPRIATTNVTAGTITPLGSTATAFSTATGAVTNGSDNVFHEGDLLVVRAGGAIVAASAGTVNVSFKVERLPGS